MEVVHVLDAVVRRQRYSLKDTSGRLLLLPRGRFQGELEVDVEGPSVRRLGADDALLHRGNARLDVGLGRVADPAEAADVGRGPLRGVVHLGHCFYRTYALRRGRDAHTHSGRLV